MIKYHILNSIGTKFKVKIDTRIGDIIIKDGNGNKVCHARLHTQKKLELMSSMVEMKGKFLIYNAILLKTWHTKMD